MLFIIATISITAVAGIATYFLTKRNDEEQSFTTDCLMGLILLGICTVPTLILMGALDHFNVLEEYKAIPITLPLLILGFLVVWATWGDSKSGSDADDKKDDFVAEAIILTTVLSESENKSDSSNGSSSSSSSSNSDDFFLL